MKFITLFLSWLFKDFAYNLYDKAERHFVLSVAPAFTFPSPADLIYFDNSNVVPAPQGVTAPFNDEPANVWLGWDGSQCLLCVTNYNRTQIICCFQGQFPV